MKPNSEFKEGAAAARAASPDGLTGHERRLATPARPVLGPGLGRVTFRPKVGFSKVDGKSTLLTRIVGNTHKRNWV